jgi:arabinofuranosyltransferase
VDAYPNEFVVLFSRRTPHHETLGALAVGIVAAAGVAFFLAREHDIARLWGFSLDDSWIHATVARNLADGHGYSFNPGEPTGGSTSPLYTFLLAGLFAIVGPTLWAAKSIGIAAHIAAAVLLFRSLGAALPASRWINFTLAVATAASPSLLWAAVSGMEISLYILLFVIGLQCYLKEKYVLATTFWCLGVWVRPDGVVLAILAVVFPRGTPIRRAAVFLGLLVPYVLFNLAVGHSLFPASVAAKAHWAGFDVHHIVKFLGAQEPFWGIAAKSFGTVLHSPLLIAGAVIGGLVGGSACRLLLAYTVLVELGFALVAADPGPQHRYVIPLIPAVAILAAFGWHGALARVQLHAKAAAQLLTGALILAPVPAALPRMAEAHGWNVQNINGMHRFLGESMRRLTSPSDTLATNDIGAIGFFSRRYVVDLVGMISPSNSLTANLTRYRPRYLILFPNWFRSEVQVDRATSNIYFEDGDSTYRYWGLFGVKLRHNTVAARDMMLTCIRTRRGDPPPPKRWMYQH